MLGAYVTANSCVRVLECGWLHLKSCSSAHLLDCECVLDGHADVLLWQKAHTYACQYARRCWCRCCLVAYAMLGVHVRALSCARASLGVVAVEHLHLCLSVC
jgi:hypothetical protein